MTTYECKRCFYKCKQRGDMIKHLNRKKKCMKDPSVYTMDDEELYKMSLDRNTIHKSNDIVEDTLVNLDENESDEESESNFSEHNNYICEKCNMAFTKKSNLSRHINKYCKNSNYSINLNNNNVTTINNQNIFNFNINVVKSFNEDWDTSNIDKYLKFALILSSNKYTNTLKCIFNNDNNLNVIYNNNNDYGLVYDKNDNKFNNMDIKEIVNISMEKLHKHLKEFHKDIHDNLKEGNLDIDKEVFDLILNNIDAKYENFAKDDNVQDVVNNIISNIYHEKYDETKKICKDLLKSDVEGY